MNTMVRTGSLPFEPQGVWTMPRSSRPSRLATAIACTAVATAAFTVNRWLAAREAAAHEPSLAATPSPAERAHSELHVRYAEARLRLAKANLEKAEDLARKVPRQVHDVELASLRRRVEVLERHVTVTKEQPHGNGFGLAQAAAKTAVKQAEDELAAVQAANARQPGAVSAATLRQLAAALELAEVRLAIWDDPSFLDSPLQVMQMQIDQLADEVFELIQCLNNRFSVDRR